MDDDFDISDEIFFDDVSEDTSDAVDVGSIIDDFSSDSIEESYVSNIENDFNEDLSFDNISDVLDETECFDDFDNISAALEETESFDDSDNISNIMEEVESYNDFDNISTDIEQPESFDNSEINSLMNEEASDIDEIQFDNEPEEIVPDNTETQEVFFDEEEIESDEAGDLVAMMDDAAMEEIDNSFDEDIIETHVSEIMDEAQIEDNISDDISEGMQESNRNISEIENAESETIDQQQDVESASHDSIYEYITSHNYGRQDASTYQADPEWQRLNNEDRVNQGLEAIDYNATEEDQYLEDIHNQLSEVYCVPEDSLEFSAIMQNEQAGWEAIHQEPIVEGEMSEESVEVIDETFGNAFTQNIDVEESITDISNEINYASAYEGLDEYNFDGIDCFSDIQRLNSSLDNFQSETWEHLSIDEQKIEMKNLTEYVKDVIGFDNPPQIDYYNNPVEGDFGGYSKDSNTLHVNEYMLYNNEEAADTVAHELWHAYQYQRANNPQSAKDYLYQYNFNSDNYIRPEDDYIGYQNQLVEAEARAFAQQFKDKLNSTGRNM